MGILIKASIFGEIKGKVGCEVICGHRSQTVIKSAPGKRPKHKEKEKRVENKTLFKLVNVFVGHLTRRFPKDLLRLGYQQAPKSKSSQKNDITSYTIKNAILGEFPDLSIDLGKIQLSNPIRSTEIGRNARVEAVGEEIKVSWELNPLPEKTTRRDDKLVFVGYDLSIGKGVTMSFNKVERSELSCSVLPAYIYQGHEMCCWVFFLSADGKRVSKTQCLGTIIVPNEEETPL